MGILLFAQKEMHTEHDVIVLNVVQAKGVFLTMFVCNDDSSLCNR